MHFTCKTTKYRRIGPPGPLQEASQDPKCMHFTCKTTKYRRIGPPGPLQEASQDPLLDPFSACFTYKTAQKGSKRGPKRAPF